MNNTENNRSMNKLQPFHLAIPVNDLEKNRSFYKNVLGCSEGRSSDHWVDFDFYGHQLVLHYKETNNKNEAHNTVDCKDVPIPHFGVVLSMSNFKTLATRLQEKNITFIIEPYIRFEGEQGEQATMFFRDPSGNALEFKAFNDINQLFAK